MYAQYVNQKKKMCDLSSRSNGHVPLDSSSLMCQLPFLGAGTVTDNIHASRLSDDRCIWKTASTN